MGWSEQRITCSKLKCMLLVRIIWEVNIGVVRAKDHLFQAEVLFYHLHVTSEGHKASEYKRWSEKRITCSKLKSFSTLCMFLVRIIKVVNIRSGQSKRNMFVEYLFGGGQRKGSPVPS